jgi:PAS domain S-box-containing protein
MTTLSPAARLLIVDDEALHMRALCDTLEQEGYSTTGFTSAKAALEAMREQEFDLVLTDLMMPEMDGISLLRAAFEIDKALVGIVMTGQGTIPTAVDAMKMGALDYILKPFKLSAVLPIIERGLRVRRLRLENIQLQETVAIYELSIAIALAADSETIVRKMAEAAFQQGDASSVAVFLSTSDGKDLRAAVALGNNADNVHGRRLPITHAVSSWVAHTEKLFSNPDELSKLQPFPTDAGDLPGGISIPMRAAGKLVGMLHFSPLRPERAVPVGRIKTLNILAGTAASALHSAWLLEELRTAEQRYRRLADNAPDVVFRYELQGGRRCVYMSPAVRQLSGYAPEEFYRDPELAMKVVHPEDRALLQAAFRGELKGETVTLRWIGLHGNTVWIEQRHVLVQDREGRLLAVEGIARDITERVKLEEQLRQSQRMEAVGRLAGGVAHDFNNMLTVINGYSDLALSEAPLDSRLREHLEQVRRAGDKAAELTRQLLAFSRKQVLQPRVLNLNEVVETHFKMLSRVLGEDIDLVTVLEPNLGHVKGDPGQLGQVLMNLVVNARDAMPQGGKLTIETHNVVLDDTYARSHVGVTPGSYVMLMVSDTGSGMDAATASKIFEPFFTTKERGKGTGLGLSIVYGIVKQSGGNIWVYSEPGRGTTFKIYLPRTHEQDETAAAAAAAAAPRRLPTGSESILVVEDDAGVRELTCTILRAAGYRIFEARDVHHAMALLREHKTQIGLVLTDLVMPEISGVVLAEQLKSITPEIKVLYTSGYSDEVMVRHGHLEEGMPFIQKPFGAADLLEKVRAVLDVGKSSES